MRRGAESRLAAVVVVAVGLVAGCTTTHRMTDTSRSATEQLLLNSALECALGTIDFRFFNGMNVYYDNSGMDALDKGWVNHRIRESLALCGARLCATREEADVVVEASAGTYGTNSISRVVGIRGMNMLPDSTFAQGDDQYGVTSLSVFATDRATGNLLWRTGPRRCDSHLRTRFHLGIGPFYKGTVQHPAETYEPFRDQRGTLLDQVVPGPR